MTAMEQRQIIGDLVADLERMNAEEAIDLSQWPAAKALIDAYKVGNA